MQGEVHVDNEATGVKMISKIDFTAIFQTGMSVAAISLVVLVLRLSNEMSLVEYKIDQLTQQQSAYATKDQLSIVTQAISNCLPRSEADSRGKMRDMTEDELKARIINIESKLQARK